MTYLATMHEFIEGTEGFRKIHASARPVNKIQVNIIHAKALKRALASLENLFISQMSGIDLGSYEQRIAFHTRFTNCLTNQFFRVAICINFGCIKVGIPSLQRGAQGGQ